MNSRTFIAVVALTFFSSCGGGTSEAPRETTAKSAIPNEAAQPKAKPVAAKEIPEKVAAEPPTTVGSVAGRVILLGNVPARRLLEANKDVEVCGKTEHASEELLIGINEGVANAVVFLKGVSGGRVLEMPTENPVIDQVGCRYEPHVLLVPAGATIDIVNSDGILHNLHTYSSINPPFNAAQPKFKKVISKKLDHAEVVKLTCDVHGWMIAWIVVHEHPYYVLTDANGGFRLEGVPPGEYDIEVWHETLGSYAGKVKVEPGIPTRHDVPMSPPA